MKALKKEIVLVTGGTGRLGRHITTSLIDKGMEVRVLVQTKEDTVRAKAGSIPYLGDITDEKAIEKACVGADIVIHLAAMVSQYKTGLNEIMRINTLGTRKLAEIAKKSGVKKIIFASTINVYGRVRKEELSEESRLMPTDSYGQSKLLAEKEIIDSGLDYTILRMATIYGPGFESSFLKVFKAVKEGKAFIIGNGNNNLSLVHIKDVVRAFELVLEKRENSRNKIYNITDGRTYTQKYLLTLAANTLGVEAPEKHVNTLVAKMVAKARGLDTDELRFITSDRKIDISKARKELGFKPTESVESGAGYLLSKFNISDRRKVNK